MKKIIFVILTAVLLYPHSASVQLLKEFSKYELKVSLPKYTYKQFEPVKVMIEMINHDSDPLELWGNFEPPLYFAGARITDQDGNVFNENQSRSEKFDMSYRTPTNIIQPGDTLYLTMSINDWGKEARFVSLEDNDIYFGNRGYFEKGKYTARISTTIKSDSGWEKRVIIKSNDVNFEVVGLNDTDREILTLFKQADFLYNIKPYKDVIDKFPNNPFTEHVYTYYLGGKYLNYYSDKNYKYINNLETEYQDFISKYPNSVYLIDGRFIEPYIYKYFMDVNANMLKDDFEQRYEEFLSQNEHNMLKYFLKDKRRVKVILGIE